MNESQATAGTALDAETIALREVHEAGLQTAAIIAELDGKPAPSSQPVISAVTEGETDVLRQRARRQRERGLKDIARRYDGIASVLIAVKLNERVVGSAFERFFPAIENGIYVMSKHGEMFLGDKAADKLMEAIAEKIKTMQATTEADLAGTAVQLEVHQTAPDFIKPTYVAPAAEHNVQVRTRMAADFCKLFFKLDAVMTNLQTLAWNGQVEISQIDDQEYRIKKDVRDLAQFIARSIRGMRNKVAPKAEATPAANSDTAEAAA